MYNAISTKDFSRKLKKLNPRLRVDHERIVYPHPDYPTCGLYNGNKYLFAVPQIAVPQYTVAGFDFARLGKDWQQTQKVLETGYVPRGYEQYEEFLWRGYRAILTQLCRFGDLNKEKAQKEFKIRIEPRCLEFPRNFINLPNIS